MAMGLEACPLRVLSREPPEETISLESEELLMEVHGPAVWFAVFARVEK